MIYKQPPASFKSTSLDMKIETVATGTTRSTIQLRVNSLYCERNTRFSDQSSGSFTANIELESRNYLVMVTNWKWIIAILSVMMRMMV